MIDSLDICPFCGSNAVIIETFDDFYVKCELCENTTKHFPKKIYSKAACACAVKAWNRRTNSELAFIQKYITNNIEYKTLNTNILCSLWTSYCIRHEIFHDSYEYKRDLNILWQILSKSGIYKNIEDFKKKLGRYIY